MNEVIVSQDTLYEMMYQATVRSVGLTPRDVTQAVECALQMETNELARMHLETMLENSRLCAETDSILCADTGYNLFWVKVGENIRLEGGFSSLYRTGRQVVADATKKRRLRPNMVHPLTHESTGDNTGLYMPRVEIQFDPKIDYLEVIAVAKGGGSEGSGTFFTMISTQDRHQGVIKFILDCIRESTFLGKTCGPNIVGIGIGGTTDFCMRMAKEAAVLRPVGSRHPDPAIAKMEDELLDAAMFLNRGPMGTGGLTGLLDVHIEYAATNAVKLSVAFQAQCGIVRRAIARYGPMGVIEYDDMTNWDYR